MSEYQSIHTGTTVDSSVSFTAAITASVNEINGLDGLTINKFVITDSSGILNTSDIQETDLSLTDVTTANATTSLHGLLPKLSGSTSQYLDGAGNFSTPSTTENYYLKQEFTLTNTITVNHNFGTQPLVQTVVNSFVVFPFSIEHLNDNSCVVAFSNAVSGYILASLGTPQIQKYTSINANYSVVSDDYFIEASVSGITITLPDATVNASKVFNIDNSAAASVFVDTTSSQTINGALSLEVFSSEAKTIVSNGLNYRIK